MNGIMENKCIVIRCFLVCFTWLCYLLFITLSVTKFSLGDRNFSLGDRKLSMALSMSNAGRYEFFYGRFVGDCVKGKKEPGG